MKNIKYIIVLCLGAISFFACSEKVLDINEDPNNPRKGDVALLLPGVEVAISNYSSYMNAGVGSLCGTFVHQILYSGNSYNMTANAFGITESWESFTAGALQDLKELIKVAEGNDDMAAVGVAKILKAYIFSILVDLWGDVPYFEANMMPKIMHPKPDKGEVIYKDLIRLLDEAKMYLKKEAVNPTNLAAADLFYGGNTNQWMLFANTLKLRLYNQMRLHSSFDAKMKADMKALVAKASDSLMKADGGLAMKYGTSVTPDNRNPMYASEYGDPDGHVFRISHWFYNTMTGGENAKEGDYNPVFKGVKDPRLPYYFYNQYEDGDKPVDYEVGDFRTNRFGSTHKDVNSGAKAYTALGLYPIGGRYDDGKGGLLTHSKSNLRGPGDVEFRLLPYFNSLYIRAELALKQSSGEDAAAILKQAIEASFAEVNETAKNPLNTLKVPQIADTTRDKYVKKILDKYNAGTDDEKLEIILTQKWIASLGSSPVDLYNDYRRTGYPKMFDPSKDSSPSTIKQRDFPVCFMISSHELKGNKNVTKQRNPSTDRVFWDIN